jgi:hypothetical protein
MDLSHDSTTVLGQLRKGQAESNLRLDAIRVELQRLNVHLEQLAAAVASQPSEPDHSYPVQVNLAQVVSTLRPKALAMWAHLQSRPRDLWAQKRHYRMHVEPPGHTDGDRVRHSAGAPSP